MRRGHGAATLDPPQMIGALVIGVPYQLLTLGEPHGRTVRVASPGARSPPVR
jgi:hypothetical protein